MKDVNRQKELDNQRLTNLMSQRLEEVCSELKKIQAHLSNPKVFEEVGYLESLVVIEKEVREWSDSLFALSIGMFNSLGDE